MSALKQMMRKWALVGFHQLKHLDVVGNLVKITFLFKVKLNCFIFTFILRVHCVLMLCKLSERKENKSEVITWLYVWSDCQFQVLFLSLCQNHCCGLQWFCIFSFNVGGNMFVPKKEICYYHFHSLYFLLELFNCKYVRTTLVCNCSRLAFTFQNTFI